MVQAPSGNAPSGHIDLVLRTMREDDLPQLLAIEDESFQTPWTAEAFRQELQTPGAWARVAADGEGHLIGYLVCRLLFDVWHVLDLAVSPTYRGCGVARLLLEELLHVAASSGDDVTLEVRPSNAAALALYRGLGFVERGRRSGYYDDTQEDALIMTVDIAKWGRQ